MDENLLLFSSSSGSLETNVALPARSCTSDSDPWREILDSLNSDRYYTSELHDVFSVLPDLQPQQTLSSDVSRKRTADRLDSSRRCNSESLEGVYGETKKIRPKRTRSAELHKMSERIRRDKIRMKLKTLQQLIPNCNKTDRASLLDDAIEYLKALKLQVEMMSRRYQAPTVLPEKQFCPILPSDMGINSSCYPPGFPIMLPTNANFPTLQSQLPYLSQAAGFNFQESTRRYFAVSYQEIAMMKKELNHVIPDNNLRVRNEFQYGTMIREPQFTEEIGCNLQPAACSSSVQPIKENKT